MINLLDSDELYDLEADPHEMTNRIDDADCAQDRERLHNELLREMNASRDPMRNQFWADRPWRDEVPAELTAILWPNRSAFPLKPSVWKAD